MGAITNNNSTHNQVFSDNNFANITIDPASDNVSDNGKTAADWAQPSQLQIIGNVIAANPAIDTVQLTIGGNDFLNNWTIKPNNSTSANTATTNLNRYDHYCRLCPCAKTQDTNIIKLL